MLIAATDSLIVLISTLAVLLVAVSFVLKRFHQPYIVGYILAGVILGKQGLGLITDIETTKHFAEIGIILLLFFIGMEISLPRLVKLWKIAVVGTLLQVVISVVIMLAVGWFFDWKFNRSIVLGFIIALSSSAVVIKLLEERKLMDTQIGQNVIGILLMQDIIVVPLLIACSFLGGSNVDLKGTILMLIGGASLLGVLIYIYVKQTIRLPLSDHIKNDHELQVFAAISFCFGGALFASLFGISPALGAFVGGMVMHAAQSTDWIHQTLHSFRVLFVAVFFICIGLQIDLNFIAKHVSAIGITLLAVYITNHLLNTILIRMFSKSWKDAFLGGALLAQIGELSFLIATAARQFNIIEDFSYQFTISLISLTLIVSPFWIEVAQKISDRFDPQTSQTQPAARA